MSTRIPIPEDLKRRVLVEAGHRCAIQTCKSTDIDIHHIIPWEKCKEHSFDNLVALCPNCHRRSHKGEIDRKSLLMYKAQLVSRTHSDEPLPATPEPVITNERWETKKIHCEEVGGLKFSVEIEYPHFSEISNDFRELNAILNGQAHSKLLVERSQAFNMEVSPDEWWAKLGNAFASSYSIALMTADILSIKTSIYTYGAGAAHGNHAIYGKNFLLNPIRSLDLQDCFEKPRAALACISEFCISYLERENHDKEPNEWVRTGAGPDWKNFESFYLTPGEIVIVFQRYQVSSYAQGEREVSLGRIFLEPILAAKSPLRKQWGLA